MKHELLLLGRAKASYIEEGISEYIKRLSHYTQFSVNLLKGKKNKANDPKAEGRLLLAQIPSGWQAVALDPLGRQFTSEEFTARINTWERQSVKGVCYLIGGPLGLSDEVRNRADLLFSLSKMTFTHDMARLLLVEQLYRAYTIKNGEKYHK
ncbi:23S rRNA (pseudouridine(1915)-N(3))-methyltransferase RlmH [Desulfopila sp. IMCC35008]|uniref:23S rRNA (pseudouridine(1915)-N(3))-methyltransferase RlmH n=1 Tax=Desulfopila sp. IMCC35008 TaxID=2653858 RepID=UPI0013D7C955|nr:23S rRNA (pseudouridine(1915)-N(3))-methyltransferase RlmH [Desulfopila sp. IMCC35008]